MKKVMIVDDEVLVRVGIKSLVPWEKEGYTIVADASDGQEALDKIEKYVPDIILTDLMMKPMDGFALMEKCSKKYPQIKFIILSNYNDFDNVRKAMKMGAFDYVFKLTIKSAELLNIMNEASKNIEVETRSNDADEVVYNNRGVIKKNFMDLLLSGNMVNIDQTIRLYRNAPFQVDITTYYWSLYIKIDNFEIIRKKGDFQNLELLNFTMENIMTELLERISRCDIIRQNECDFIVLMNRQGENKDEFLDKLQKEFLILVYDIKQYYGLEICGALSKEFVGIEHMAEAIRQNRMLIENRFFYQSNKLYLYQEKLCSNTESIGDQNLKPLEKIVDGGDYWEIRAAYDDFFQRLDKNVNWSPSEFRYIMRKLMRRMSAVFIKDSVDVDTICNKDGVTLEEAINGYSYYTDIKRNVLEFLDKYRSESESHTGRPCRQEISEIKKYIDNHLADDLSVSSLAIRINMSKSRFSHLFKEETGRSFQSYINQKRMDKTLFLLKTTDLKVWEIAEQVGFLNQNYFSAQFKKRTGLSPNEYRHNIWNSRK